MQIENNPKNSAWFLKRLLKTIKAKKLVLFLGAGISTNSPSNLPLASEMRESVINKVLDSNKLPKDALLELSGKKMNGITYPFEAFMEVLVKNSNFLAFLTKLFGLGSPNKTHHLIARLMKKHISSVITTNFDEKIEQASRELNAKVETEPRLNVCWNEEQFSKLDLENSKQPTLIKLHGTISDATSIRATLESVARRSLIESRSRILKQFFINLDCDVLFLGYSCSDEFDINPVIRGLKSENHVYLIEHSPETSILNSEIVPLNDPFTNFNGDIIRIDSNELVNFLYKEFVTEHWKERRGELLWPVVIDDWAKSLVGTQKLFISGQLFYHIQEYDIAKKFLQQCLILSEKDRDIYRIAWSQRQLGLIFETLSDLDNAEAFSKKSLEFFRSHGIEEDTADVLFQLGRISQQKQKLKEARQYYRESLEIYNKNNKRLEMAGVYYQMSTLEEDPTEAENLVKNSLAIFDEFGYFVGLALSNYQLGFVFIMKNDLDKAEINTNKAKSLYGLLGNKEGIADSMFQIGTIKLMKGDLEGAEAETRNAITVYQEIGKKIGLGASYFQLKQIQEKRQNAGLSSS